MPHSRGEGQDKEMFDLLESFILEKDSTLAPRTLEHYQRHLYNVILWLSDFNIHDPRDVTTDDLRDWLRARDVAPSTQHVAICALKQFFRWSVGQENPAEKIPFPKRRPTPQRTLTIAQVEQLLAHLDTSKPKGIRDLALISLLLDTGLRASEICRLELAHFDLEAQSLVVRIKGGRIGGAVFGSYTQSTVANWLSIRDQFARASTVFVSVGGNRPGTSLTRCGLGAILRQLGKESGIGLISPHDFRRSLATLAIQGGAPTRLVQLAGRWRSVKEVERYSQALTPMDFEPYSPVNRVMGL
jgi:integrase/recombinase XerD